MTIELADRSDQGPPAAPCLGVDGAKSGWIAVWWASGSLEFAVHADAAALLGAHRDAAVIAVDIPIGLSDRGPRQADVLARGFVGGRRASSIFSSPVRGALDASTQPEASRRHREIDGRGFGAQAFAILAKIREWDGLLRQDDRDRTRVFEVHPEVCFAAMAGTGGLAPSKKTDEGAALRIALLETAFDLTQIEDLLARVPRRQAARDDVLDALAALWTAERIAAKQARSLPEPVEIDSAGLTRAIYY